MRGRIYGWWALAAVLVVACALLFAAGLRPFTGPPTFDQHVMAIAADLRCPVCAGESAADSNAAAALQIRGQIAQGLQAGQTRQQILDGFVTQYGTWILYRPPGSGALAVLWLVPALAAAALAVGVAFYLRTRAVRAAPVPGPAPEAPAALRRRLQRFL